jgi:hypothetical protein
MSDPRFKEYEHKYLLNGNESIDSIFESLRSVDGGTEKSLDVTDTYLFDKNKPEFVYRHRKDREIQQLTVKSFGGDARERTEINLKLLNESTQIEAVLSFMQTIGDFSTTCIHKSIRVIDFPDCECVYYRASNGTKTVHCFEFEALGAQNLDDAIGIISKYESLAGFLPDSRCHQSLFELLGSI